MNEPGSTSPAHGHPVVAVVRDLSFETQQYIDAVARHVGLHRSDIAAIGELVAAAKAGERFSPGELARRMHLSAAAVSALVDRLERAGHVRRDRHATDGRMVLLDRTASAAATSAEMFRPLREAHEAALSGYTEAELDVAARVIVDLTRATREACEQPLPPPPEDPPQG